MYILLHSGLSDENVLPMMRYFRFFSLSYTHKDERENKMNGIVRQQRRGRRIRLTNSERIVV